MSKRECRNHETTLQYQMTKSGNVMIAAQIVVDSFEFHYFELRHSDFVINFLDRLKSFTDLFIKRPVLAMVVSFVILIAGLQAMKTLNVRQYPRSDIAAITVTTVYVGADAELVRGFITTPIERAIAAADGIDYIQSQSTQGHSSITARLKLNYDANKALSDISSRVDAIRNNLPPEAQIPVIAIQSADSQFASAYLEFHVGHLEPNEVTDYLVRLVQPRLTAVGGVQKADILGGRTFAMRIWMKPDRMAALNISPSQVRDALSHKQLSGRGREHERFAAAGQPHREHRLAYGRSIQATGRSAGQKYAR